MSGPQYYVAEGARRSVAAREAGASTIPAVLFRDGFAPAPLDAPVAALHVPANKNAVSRTDSRYRKVESGLPRLLNGILKLPIAVQPLGVPGQTASIPLAAVRLTL